MSATDELRARLDERGVKWSAPSFMPDRITEFEFKGLHFRYVEGIDFHDGEPPWCWIDYHGEEPLTPEQAVEVLFGRDNSDAMRRLWQLRGGHYGWPTLYEAVTGEGFTKELSASETETAFIEKLICLIGGSAFVCGECTADETETIKALYNDNHHIKHVTVHVMECSACGHTYEHVNGDYEYCPHCGRRMAVDA